LVDLAAAAEEKDGVVRDGDSLEVALDRLVAEEEMLVENPAPIVDFPDLADLVALREQAAVPGQRQSRDFSKRRGKDPSSERRSGERGVVVCERLLQPLLPRHGGGASLHRR
jgi:hypothetical protein